MKKNSKIVIILLILTAILAGSAFAKPVELLQARPVSRGGMGAEAKVTGFIEIENLSYHKQVIVHYYNRQSSGWHQAFAYYVKSSGNNKEIWKFDTPWHSFSARLSGDFQFAIEYKVNGQSYWDNNNGSDYKLSIGSRTIWPAFALGKSAIMVYSKRSIALRDLAYQKTVKIIYTYDNWNTVQTTYAFYMRTYYADSSIQLWGFNLNTPGGSDLLKFAVEYQVGGQSYWDNNGGINYTINSSSYLY